MLFFWPSCEYCTAQNTSKGRICWGVILIWRKTCRMQEFFCMLVVGKMQVPNSERRKPSNQEKISKYLMVRERLYCEMAGVCKCFAFNKTKLRKWLKSPFFFLSFFSLEHEDWTNNFWFKSKVPSEHDLQLSSFFTSLATSRWHYCPVIVGNERSRVN